MTNTIHVERAKKRMSQEKLAKAIGVHRQTIFAIESKKYMPNGVLMLKLAEYFKVPVEDIFKLEDSDREKIKGMVKM